MARREFPNDTANDMDAAAVKILVSNMRAGAAPAQHMVRPGTSGQGVRATVCGRVVDSDKAREARADVTCAACLRAWDSGRGF